MKNKLLEERKIMEKVWGINAAYKGVWNPLVPSTGQCYITALYLYTKYGGSIMYGYTKDNIKHYWNKIDGKEYDLTSDQFGGDGITPIISKPGIDRYPNFKNKRYILFKQRMDRYHAMKYCSTKCKNYDECDKMLTLFTRLNGRMRKTDF